MFTPAMKVVKRTRAISAARKLRGK